MENSARALAVAVAGTVGLLAGCASNADPGVVTVYRQPSGPAPFVSRVSFRTTEAKPPESARDVWYAEYLRRDDPCWNPFLVIESSDGGSAKIFVDGRCR